MAVIWALNFSIVKIALATMPPMAFNALRYPLAGATVYVILRASGPIPRPRRNDIWRVLALGILGNFIYQLFFITGVERTEAGTASLLLAGTPMLATLLSAALGHERITRLMSAAVPLQFVGLVLVITGSAQSAKTGLHPP